MSHGSLVKLAIFGPLVPFVLVLLTLLFFRLASIRLVMRLPDRPVKVILDIMIFITTSSFLIGGGMLIMSSVNTGQFGFPNLWFWYLLLGVYSLWIYKGRKPGS